MPALWQITLLGALRAARGAETVARFRSQKAGGLLAYLALFPRRVQTREELIDLFWPDADLDAGRVNLRTVLASLRRQFEPPGVDAGSVLVTRGHINVALNPKAFVTDVAAFEQMLAAAETSEQPEQRAQRLSEAARLYAGPLLPGRYEDWVLTERDRLAARHIDALRSLTQEHEKMGNGARALDAAHRAVAADPLSEEAHLDVLRLLTASGQSGAAQRHYQEMTRLFDAHLGAAPPAEARHLLAAGRISLPSPSARPLPPVPAAYLPQPPAPPAFVQPVSVHLPLTLTRFFGREDEMARICSHLTEADSARLLTVTGAGGTGKSRLAIEAARRLGAEFSGGICFVALADVRDAEQFFETVAAALCLPQTPTLSPRAQAVEALRQRSRTGPVLLLFDNFEQIVEGAAAHVHALLADVPRLSCLVTSRQRLMLDGERELALAPLTLPECSDTPERLLDFSSVQLFVNRAQSVRPDFQLTQRSAAVVTELCRRLEGLPLALELAAARTQTLSLPQILERLDRRFELLVSRRRDVMARQGTLHATVAWSFHLLPPALKRFFAGLSVFTGGWTLEAAEDVLDEPRALDCLSELQERSLIVRAEEKESGRADWKEDATPRFRMLETLREFAAQQLTEEERTRLEARHFQFCLRLAERADLCLRGPEQVAQLFRLHEESENLRAMLTYSLRSEDAERQRDGQRLAAALGWFWFRHSRFREGREWLERALEIQRDLESDGDKAARIRILHAYAFIVNYQGEYARACSLFQVALTLAEEIGDEAQAVYSLYGFSMMSGNCPDVSENAPPYRAQEETGAECLRRAQATGDRRLIAYGNFARAFAALHTGKFATAKECILDAAASFRASNDTWETANVLSAQGVICHFSGDLQTAAPAYAAAIRLSKQSEYGIGVFWGLYGLASVAARRGQAECAARLFGAVEHYAEAIHMVVPQACRVQWKHDEDVAREALGGPDRFDALQREGRRLTLEEAITFALP